MKLISQILFIAIGVVVFFTYIRPEYQSTVLLRAEVAEYDEALNNAKELQQKRDEILASYNSISQSDKARLNNLLPDINDDKATSGSIALVLEIDKIATKNGIRISDISFSSDSSGEVKAIDEITSMADYASSIVSFKMQSSYGNFLSFVSDLENNLRIMDIKKVSFAAPKATRENPVVNTNFFEYSFELQSYWLKK